MNSIHYQLIIYGDEPQELTLERLAHRAGLEPAVLESFVEYGLVEPQATHGTEMLFNLDCIPRLRTIIRLRRDIGVNLSGIGVILDLLEKVQALRRENESLRSKL